ncbi:MAG: hypothetical protein ACKVW3_03920 [Phycisphaerales bacterium]
MMTGLGHRPSRDVQLVREPGAATALPGPGWWRVGLEAAAAGLLLVVVGAWLASRGRRDPLERAFRKLARAQGLGAGARHELRAEAARRGMPGPVVLMLCGDSPEEPREASEEIAALSATAAQ